MNSEERRLELMRRVEETFQLDPSVTIKFMVMNAETKVKEPKVFLLVFNNMAVKGVLKDTGMNLMSTGFGITQMTSPEIMGAMLYWGLKTEHPDITPEDVDRMYHIRHYKYTLGKITEAIQLFMPNTDDLIDPDEGNKGVEDEGKDPLSPSTPLGSTTTRPLESADSPIKSSGGRVSPSLTLATKSK